MLTVKNIQVSYGNIVAVRDVSFSVAVGQIVCLVGPNGAGKTTTLRALSGLVPIKEGHVELEGVGLTNKPAYEIARAGLVPVPEGRRIFSRLSVKDNLVMGAYTEKDAKRQTHNYEKVLSLFPELKERLNQFGGTLSGGEQQMLAIGRALMANPKVLLLDEPSMGLAPIIVEKIFAIIKEIQNEGTTVLLVEQNANMALQIADYAYVLERGSIVLQDTGKAMLQNEAVILSYLGGRKN